jgi:hypothetical protein
VVRERKQQGGNNFLQQKLCEIFREHIRNKYKIECLHARIVNILILQNNKKNKNYRMLPQYRDKLSKVYK